MKKSEKIENFRFLKNFEKVRFFEKIHTIKEDFQNLDFQILKIFFNGVNFLKKSHFSKIFKNRKFSIFSDFFH